MTPDWHRAAACLDMPIELFFPDRHDTATEATAVTICATCPVRTECLDAALDHEGGAGRSGRYGIQGGLTPAGRRREYERRTAAARRTGAAPKPTVKEKENKFRAKLTPALRAEIRTRYADGESMPSLARAYSVARSTIQHTVKGVARTKAGTSRVPA